jgi:hypothetical protein
MENYEFIFYYTQRRAKSIRSLWFFTNFNYLSSNVLSLYCIFDVQNLVLCLNRELIKIIDYKIILKLKCKTTFNSVFVGKKIIKIEQESTWNNVFNQNRPRIDFGIMFWKIVVLYEIYSKKLQWPNTFCTSLYIKCSVIRVIKPLKICFVL